MTGVQNEDGQFAVINAVQDPVIADPDSQDAMGAGQHLGSGRAGIGRQGIDRFGDSPLDRFVER